jgi:hypothetical protein
MKYNYSLMQLLLLLALHTTTAAYRTDPDEKTFREAALQRNVIYFMCIYFTVFLIHLLASFTWLNHDRLSSPLLHVHFVLV